MTDGAGAVPPMTVLNPAIDPPTPNSIGSNLNDPIMTDAAAADARAAVDPATAGMQAFVFNTRRDIFKDKRLRQALAYGFDFEWSNKTLFYGQYARTHSFFSKHAEQVGVLTLRLKN